MTTQDDARLQPPAEQIIYANILTFGVWSCLAMMVIFYCLYVFGVITPHISFEVLTANWGKGVHEYLVATQTPQGWGWLYLLGKGDFLNYVGFGILALLTNICFVILLIGYVKKKDWIYAAISLTEIIVLTLAASGIFGSGGH
jgi:hypothetical protein